MPTIRQSPMRTLFQLWMPKAIGKISDKVFLHLRNGAIKTFCTSKFTSIIIAGYQACHVCKSLRFLIGQKIPSFVHHNNLRTNEMPAQIHRVYAQLIVHSTSLVSCIFLEIKN